VHLAVKARAMNDGDLGEQVEVRNLQSDRVVTGTVIGKNKVGAR
jgi:flagella basal body P-ring formation protein FlgA